MPNTHCLPTGSLATGEEPVPAVPMGVTVNGPAPGSRRGIVILVPGLTGSAMPCPPLNADVTGLLPGYFATLMLNLNRDGWLTAYLPPVGYNYYTSQLGGLQNLVATDAGHGTLYLNAALRWWDHVVWWVQQNYGSTMPIVVWGLSWGGWHSFQIAKARTSTISAYIAMVPAEPLWTFQIANMAGGAASTTTVTNTYTWPLTSPTVVTVNSVAGFSAGGGVVVIQAGGSNNWTQCTYTSTSAGQFNGVLGGPNTGAGTFAPGTTIIQSGNTSGMDVTPTGLNTIGNGAQGVNPPGYIQWETGDSLIGYQPTSTLFTNASGAGQSVTSRQVGTPAAQSGQHQMTQADVAFLTANTWSAATAYVVNQIVVNAGVSYICIANNTNQAPPNATFWTAIGGGPTTQGWVQTTLDVLAWAAPTH